jgi:dipeptidase
MACDIVVALGRATVDRLTLFGLNSEQPAGQGAPLCRIPGRAFALGEKVRTQFLELPQPRQTYTVLGRRPLGQWGLDCGINEHQVAAGCVPLRSVLAGKGVGLLGTDLVRLTLERTRTARQGVDLLTDLVERYGQGAFLDCPAPDASDCALVIADPAEAYAVETAGPYWVYQEIQEVRAIGNVRTVRQDWDRISHGLAPYAFEQGWWPDDGSKLDFAGALRENPAEHGDAMRRWGRATLLLTEQNGHIDTAFLRRLLSDHGEDAEDPDSTLTTGPASLCRHATRPNTSGTAASFVTALSADSAHLPMVWCAFGTPCTSVYLPVLLDGELPAAFTSSGSEESGDGFGWRLCRFGEQLHQDPERWARVHDSFARLQARFDQEAEEFLLDTAALKKRGTLTDLQRQASLLMAYHLERLEEVLAEEVEACVVG